MQQAQHRSHYITASLERSAARAMPLSAADRAADGATYRRSTPQLHTLLIERLTAGSPVGDSCRTGGITGRLGRRHPPEASLYPTDGNEPSRSVRRLPRRGYAGRHRTGDHSVIFGRCRPGGGLGGRSRGERRDNGVRPGTTSRASGGDEASGRFTPDRASARRPKANATSVSRWLISDPPEAGSRKPEAGSRKPEASSRKPAAGSQQPEASSRKPAAGSQQPAESRMEAGCRKAAGSQGCGQRQPVHRTPDDRQVIHRMPAES